MQREPKRFKNGVLQKELFNMSDESSFLQAEDEVQDKLLIFGGTKGKESLKEYKSFFMDGAFKSCSSRCTNIHLSLIHI